MLDADATQWLHPDVVPLDRGQETALRARIDGKAKPPGSLGRIEELALQLGLIAQPAQPRADNAALYKKYQALATQTPDVHFVGRLATYRYYNMDQVVGQALTTFAKITGQGRGAKEMAA